MAVLLAHDRSTNSEYLDPRGINTRAHGAPTLVVPKCRRGQAQRAVGFRSSTAWNRLPPDIRNQKKRKGFKRKLDRYLGIMAKKKV